MHWFCSSGVHVCSNEIFEDVVFLPRCGGAAASMMMMMMMPGAAVQVAMTCKHRHSVVIRLPRNEPIPFRRPRPYRRAVLRLTGVSFFASQECRSSPHRSAVLRRRHCHRRGDLLPHAGVGRRDVPLPADARGQPERGKEDPPSCWWC